MLIKPNDALRNKMLLIGKAIIKMNDRLRQMMG